MTIYDVPVSDTKFFPVSGDTLRQMKHEEQQAEIRRRDNAIRTHMPPHRAEYLIRLLNKENGTGNPAKSSPDAADLTNYQEDQIAMNDTSIVSETADPDVSYHPIWCDPDACIPPLEEDDDVTLHVMNLGELRPRSAHPAKTGITVDMVQVNNGRPKALITNGDVELDIDELERLITMLCRTSTRLAETGEA